MLQDTTPAAGMPMSSSPTREPMPEGVQISPRVRTGRKLWLKIHLYIGLVLGLELALVGLTGSLLVFYREIDAWLNPGLLTTRGTGAHQSIDRIFAAAQAAVPDAQGSGALLSVYMPWRVSATYLAWAKIPGETAEAERWQQISLDPYSGAVLGVREAEEYLISILYHLHYTLLLGEWGETAVGISGLLLLISSITGVYLWWPRRGKIGQALTINYHTSRTRLNFDLHRVSGAYVALILLVVAFSGVYMIFPEYVKVVVQLFSPVTELPKHLQSTPSPDRAPLIPSQAIAAADTVFPDAELTSITLTSLASEGVYVIYKRQAGEVRKSSGASMVWVDQYSGAVLDARDPRTMSAGDTFLRWQFPLHNGEAFGLPGRVVILLSGLTIPLLYVTGLFIWLRKRRAHRRAARGHT
jgi:uncharacterized iron-regulated membrane protein